MDSSKLMTFTKYLQLNEWLYKLTKDQSDQINKLDKITIERISNYYKPEEKEFVIDIIEFMKKNKKGEFDTTNKKYDHIHTHRKMTIIGDLRNERLPEYGVDL